MYCCFVGFTYQFQELLSPPKKKKYPLLFKMCAHYIVIKLSLRYLR